MSHDGTNLGRRVTVATRLATTLASILATGIGSLAWAGFIPGGGSERSDCYTELWVEGVDNPGPQVKRNRVVSCTDGDPCDSVYPGPTPRCDGVCEFNIAICVGQTDPNLPTCLPAPLRDFDSRGRRFALISALPPDMLKGSGPSCGQPQRKLVFTRTTKDGRQSPGRLGISLTAFAKDGLGPFIPSQDQDRIVLECLPRTTPCPDVPTTTTTTLPPISTRPTVLVGAGGGILLDPDTVRIRAGDTVRWFWAGKGAALQSGTSLQPTDLFSSPRAPAGAIFEHTFPDVGTFEYFNARGFPMRGRVIVEP